MRLKSLQSDEQLNSKSQEDRSVGTTLKCRRNSGTQDGFVKSKPSHPDGSTEDNLLEGKMSANGKSNRELELTRTASSGSSSSGSSMLSISDSSEIINLPACYSSQDSGISSSQDILLFSEAADMENIDADATKQETKNESTREEPSTSTAVCSRSKSKNASTKGPTSTKRKLPTPEDITLPKKFKPSKVEETSSEENSDDDDDTIEYKARGFEMFLKSEIGKEWLNTASGKQFQSSRSAQIAFLRVVADGTRVSSSGVDSHEPESGLSAMCSICCLQPKNAVIVHGRLAHQTTCYQCARRLLDTRSRCPVCRRKIHMVCRNIIG